MKAHLILNTEWMTSGGINFPVLACQYDNGKFVTHESITLGIDEVTGMIVIFPCRNCMDALRSHFLSEIILQSARNEVPKIVQQLLEDKLKPVIRVDDKRELKGK